MTTTMNASTQNQLRQFIEQIERLEEEKKALAADIKDKFTEAKGVGFDVSTMRAVIKLRKASKAERTEAETILATYMHALGMLDGTPMGDWMEKQIEGERFREAVKAVDELTGSDNVGFMDRVDAKLAA
jgi:uncharacterized protein (UPF0335 family)